MFIYIQDIFSTNMNETIVLIKSYEPLLEAISAYAGHVTNIFAVFSVRVGQML